MQPLSCHRVIKEECVSKWFLLACRNSFRNNNYMCTCVIVIYGIKTTNQDYCHYFKTISWFGIQQFGIKGGEYKEDTSVIEKKLIIAK